MGLPDFRPCLRKDGRDLGGFRFTRGRGRGPHGDSVRGGHAREQSPGDRAVGGAAGDIRFVEPHRHPGVFIGRSEDGDLLLTKNLVVGESSYGERRITIDGENHERIEYRVWDPFKSKLAAAIMNGVDNIHIVPGTKVLYLGADRGVTLSHVSDIIGPDGLVYAVENSKLNSPDLYNVAKNRMNIIPIIENARRVHKYRISIGIVDMIYADVAQVDQARILALNTHHFLKDGGHFLIPIKASCVDPTAPPETVYASEVQKFRNERLKPTEQITLEPYRRDHAVIIGNYRPAGKWKNNEESDKTDEIEE